MASSYALDLTSAWKKWCRAKIHIRDLSAEIAKVGPQDQLIALGQKYEAERDSIVIYIESVVKIPNDWSLLVGDAVHNLKCSLDHLAWQLALRHFNGVEPTNRQTIKEIQFPICMHEEAWNKPYVNRKHMDPADANKLKQFQPFLLPAAERAAGVGHPLEAFFGFDGVENVDKHRSIELAVLAPTEKRMLLESFDDFVDCRPGIFSGTEDGPGIATYHFAPSNPPQPGDEIVFIPVVVTGPNPHVKLKVRLSAFIALRKTWKIPESIETLAETVEVVLGWFRR